MDKKRVLLTGIGGSIGVNIMAYFLEKTDWEIVGLDSFRHKGYKDRPEVFFKEHPEWRARVTIFQHDLVCPISPALVKEIGKIDHILHLAAVSDVFFSIDNPVYTIRNNIDSTLTMLEYAKHNPHETFVYFSTDEIYGSVKKGEAHPEWDTHRPSNAYSSSKAASEDICYSYWRSGDVKLIITNTMNNFSILQSASKFPVIVQKKLARGEKVTIHGSEREIGTRFYLDSRNAADALLFILQNLPPHQHVLGEIDDPDRYHIVGEKALSNLEIAQLIAGYMDKKLTYELQDFHKDNPAHDIHYGMQDNRLRKAGWQQPFSLEDSLREVVEWQQQHPEWL